MTDATQPRARHGALKLFGLAALVLLATLAAFVIFFSSGFLREVAGARGSAMLGREIAIDGPFNIDWDWATPRVHIEGLRVANVAGAADPNMLEIAQLDFSLKAWKLLLGRIDIPDMSVQSPRLVLERQDEKTANWDLPLFSGAGAAAEAAIPDSRGEVPVIGRLEVKEGHIIYRDVPRSLDVDLRLDTVTGSDAGKERFFSLSGNGKLQNQNFVLQARGGSLEMLRDSSKAYPLDFYVEMGSTHISVKGTFRDPVKLKGIDAVMDLSGGNMADLFYLTGIPLPPTPPYTISGQLRKDQNVWVFEDMKGKVGDSDLSGSLTYELKNRGYLKADLASNLLDADDIGGFIGLAPDTGAGETAAPEQKQKARREAASARVLPDVPIDLGRLRAADMDVDFKAARIEAPGWPFNEMSTHLRLKDGLLRFEPLRFTMADGAGEGMLELDGRKDVPGVKTNLDLKKLSLGRFFDGTRFEDLSKGTFGGRIELAGTGKSLAEVLASSNGRVVFTMAGGTVSLLLVEAADIDITEATPLLLGEDKSTGIRCGVGDFAVRQGVLSSQIFVLDTTDTNIEGEATIDLRNETIDAVIVANPKDASLLSLKGPVSISGPLKKPSVGLATGDMAARGAGAAVLGAVLTPVAALIPFIELGLGEDSDCRELIARARRDAGAPVP